MISFKNIFYESNASPIKKYQNSYMDALLSGNFKQAKEILLRTVFELNYDENIDIQLPSDYFGEYKSPLLPKELKVIFKKNNIIYSVDKNDIIYAIKNNIAIGFVDGSAISVDPQYQKIGIGINLLKAYRLLTGHDMELGNHTVAGSNLFYKYWDEKYPTFKKKRDGAYFSLGQIINIYK
jgi:hypothetical protein